LNLGLCCYRRVSVRFPNDYLIFWKNAENGIPPNLRQLLQRLNDHLKELDRQVDELELQIKQWHKANDASLKLEAIPGIGPITASAVVATVGNARQLAAWLGLVPKQHSSGGKSTLLGISKRGDRYRIIWALLAKDRTYQATAKMVA